MSNPHPAASKEEIPEVAHPTFFHAKKEDNTRYELRHPTSLLQSDSSLFRAAGQIPQDLGFRPTPHDVEFAKYFAAALRETWNAALGAFPASGLHASEVQYYAFTAAVLPQAWLYVAGFISQENSSRAHQKLTEANETNLKRKRAEEIWKGCAKWQKTVWFELNRVLESEESSGSEHKDISGRAALTMNQLYGVGTYKQWWSYLLSLMTVAKAWKDKKKTRAVSPSGLKFQKELVEAFFARL